MLSPLARAGVGAVAPWPSSPLLPQHGLGVGGGGGELLPLPLPPTVEEGPCFVVGQPRREPETADTSADIKNTYPKCQLLIDIKKYGKTKNVDQKDMFQDHQLKKTVS